MEENLQLPQGTWVYRPKLPATAILVGVNVAVFIAMMATGVPLKGSTGQEMILWGADYGPRTLAGEWWRLWTSNFLHFGIFHIATNMYVLWGLGRLAELFYDTTDYLLAYTFTGISASLLSVWVKPTVISGGASGAVFGVAGLLLATLKWGHLALTPESRTAIYKDVFKFAALNLVMGALLPFVDNTAHLGGLLAGLLAGWLLGRRLDPAPESRAFRWKVWAALGAVLIVSAIGVIRMRAPLVKKINAVEAMGAGRINEAVAALRKEVRQHPNDDEGHALLAKALLEQGKGAEAQAAVEAGLKLNPKSLVLLYAWAELAQKQGQPEQMAEALRRIHRLQPENEPVTLQLAQVLTDLGKKEEAEPLLREMVNKSPRLPGRHANLARLLASMGKFPEAEKEAREAVRLSPDEPEFHLDLARILRSQHSREAEKEYSAAADGFRKKRQPQQYEAVMREMRTGQR